MNRIVAFYDRGVAIAASNAGEPRSFVGSNYGFREYFLRAMAEGSAAQFALGSVSGRPGLYLSRRVDGADGPLGIVAVKVEFGDLQKFALLPAIGVSMLWLLTAVVLGHIHL